MKYLLDVLFMLQRRAYYAHRIPDWDSLKADLLAQIGDAQSPSDAYSAIQTAVERLGDQHSFFIPANQTDQGPTGKPSSFGFFILSPENVVSEIFPGSAADLAGIREWDVVETINGQPLPPSGARFHRLGILGDHLHVRLCRSGQIIDLELDSAPIEKAPLPRGYLLEEGIGYLELFVQGPPTQQQEYIDTLHDILRTVKAQKWVVDLRRNRGGNMWPMLAGCGPLMGEGVLGGFVGDQKEKPNHWYYQDSAACYTDPETGAVTAYMKATDPVPVFDPAVTPVAVLTSELTGSAGEMTLAAFRGRPNLRTFGHATQGLTTAVAMHTLEDGAILGISESICADRTGQTYDTVIEPDEPVAIDWRCYGTSADPVIQSALNWLRS